MSYSATVPPSKVSHVITPLRLLFAGVVVSAAIVAPPSGVTAHTPLALTATPITDDGRVGTVLDQQGNAQVRPAGRRRWSPLFSKTPLWPDDEVRTSPRGANAVEMEVKGGKVTLGPGAIAQLGGDGAVHVLAGEVEINPASGQNLTVQGPGGFSATIAARGVLRATDTKTERLATDPRWLTGYRGSTTAEWMGSLLAKVDGRDVPLYVGYHKVTVEIRDQIARTTVEQSFVNSTDSRLEGTFYFPLPADASISGFGMWIGNELVEADIVEKQRARAIFEQILRERRDPGLLEWAGGNQFKARVFPIEARSEKRVLLRYTQVLPLQGDEVVYRYALRSELLRTRPLRELAINLAVSSAVEIAGISSPTHAVRVSQTGHTATIDFDAREYTPERDLEVRCKVRGQAGLTVIPHRRGDDGYFALLFAAPAGDVGPWRRELVPDGKALDVVLVADTSASMDRAARGAQAAFVDAFLALLGPEDRFQLIAADVDAQPLGDAQAATPASIATALQALAQRPSLGWTDLDRAMQVALSGGAGRTVVYVGDGIPTARGDSNPDVVAQRLRAQLGARAVHAVTLAATYDAKVLHGLTGAGGSLRRGGDTPARAALDLLAEIAQPPAKDLRVRFEGLQTSRVYPATLPNLPAGAQQFVLGRYLPAATAQRGRVIVTGTIDGKPIELSAAVELPASDAGNSFLPRLWARQHVDALLAQGDGGQIKNDVIALSAEFGIMTPFTSLLVLENDEDRARFGVTRAVKMRDGEQFFASGRDAANLEARRAQAQKARAWRLQLRAEMLAELARLGEELYGWHVGYAEGQSRSFAKSRLAGADESRLGVQRDAKELSSDGDDRVAETETDAPRDHEAPKSEEALAPIESRQVSAPATLAFKKNMMDRGDEVSERARFASIGGRLASGLFRQEAAARASFAFAFPGLAAATPESTPKVPDWPDEVFAALRPLDIRAWLGKQSGGVRMLAQHESLHAQRQHVTGQQRLDLVWVGGQWLVDGQTPGQQTVREWSLDGERGVAQLGWLLGRRRVAAPTDVRMFTAPLHEAQFDMEAHAQWTPTLRKLTGDTVEIVLSAPDNRAWQQRLEVDVARGVLLSRAFLSAQKVQSTSRFSEFVTVAGRWWPTRMETLDAEGRPSQRATFSVEAFAADAALSQVRAARAACAGVVFLGEKAPELAAAKQAIAERKARIDDHVAVTEHFASSQQWEPALAGFAGVEALAPASAGVAWLRALLLWSARSGDVGKDAAQKLVTVVQNAPASERAFLAGYLMSAPLHAHERLELLAALTPSLLAPGDDAPARRLALHALRADRLAELGRWSDVATERAAIATGRPFDFQSAIALVHALSNSGQRAAVGVRCAEIAGWPGLDAYEGHQLFDHWTNSVWAERDASALVEIAQKWRDAAPGDEQAHTRWLSAMLFAGRESEVDAHVRACLAEPIVAADQAQAARLAAAMQLVFGQGWQFYAQEIDVAQLPVLSALLERLLDTDSPHLDLIERALGHWQFQQTDACPALRQRIVTRLLAAQTIETTKVVRLTRWLHWAGLGAVDDATFAVVKQRLRARFDAAKDTTEADAVGSAFLSIAQQKGRTPDVAAFLRAWLARSPANAVPNLAQQLLGELFGEPWSVAVEAEVLALLPRLMQDTDDAATQRRTAGNAVRNAAHHLALMRERDLLGPVEELERLERSARRAKETAVRQQARVALAEALHAAVPAALPVLRPWLQVEALCCDARTTTSPRAVDGAARELLASTKAEAELHLVRERCALVIAFLATRKGAPIELADAAVALLVGKEAAEETGIDWRAHLVRLLIALDRHDAVVATLQRFVVASEVANPWRVPLAYFLAERGELKPAVELLDAVAKLDELGADEWRVLADWRLALGDDAGFADAQRRRYAVMQDWQISQIVQAACYRLQSRGEGVPGDLEPETLVALRELLRKATDPENHVQHAENLYRATKDFRTLVAFTDAILGHTPQQIYPALQRATSVFEQVHEEATCDSVLLTIAELRSKATGVTDRRALDLLEVVVARRAAKVKNQPQEHARRALQCLQAAHRDSFLPGEPALFARLLASLGMIEDGALAAEQRRQLRALHAANAPTDADGLAIARWFADVEWRYGQHEAAIDELRLALETYRRAQGTLNAVADEACDLLISYYTTKQRFVDAETFLRGEVAAQPERERKDRFVLALAQLWSNALSNRGWTMIGRGAALYQGARKELQEVLFVCQPSRVPGLVSALVQLHRVAKQAGVETSAQDLSTFALGPLFEVATRTAELSANLFSEVAQALGDLGAPRAGLELLVTRIEREPAWLQRCGQGGWQPFGYALGRLHEQSRPGGELAGRLLRVVLAALERDLTSGRSHSRALYTKSHSFWAEHQAEFQAVADAVVARNLDSGATRLYVAEYLWHGLEAPARAIDVLRQGESRGKLSDDGRARFVAWLSETGAAAEAVPVARALVAAHPDAVEHRCMLAKVVHAAGQVTEAAKVLAEGEQRLRAQKRLGESALAQLAHTSLECALHARTAELYAEVIALHQRGSTWRGDHNGTLAVYYGNFGRALVALARFDEAVDAACAGVVAWGPQLEYQRQALTSVQDVLAQVPDLTGWLGRYDERVQRTASDAPVLRKAIARVFASRNEHRAAVAQWRLALALQPLDEESHKELVAALDQTADKTGATQAVLAWAAAFPHRLAVYVDLGERLTQQAEKAAAERAFTSTVELLPDEAEGHRLLAAHRRNGQRFADEVLHRRRVVEIRSDEPDGLLLLAQAEVDAGARDAAFTTLQRVLDGAWDARFGDIKAQAARQRDALRVPRPPR